MNINFTVDINTENGRKEALNWLKENLSEERFEHTLGVEECARFLAEKYGLNSDKAALAGLLHDCAKCFPTEELSNILRNEIKDVQPDELLNYKTFHAPVGEYFARKIFKVNDPEILSAIRFHTLGKVNMTIFEKIIFLADKIEARTRDEEYRQMILKILNDFEGERGLDEALFVCFKETVKSLVKRELAICPATIDVYNELLQKVKNSKK